MYYKLIKVSKQFQSVLILFLDIESAINEQKLQLLLILVKMQKKTKIQLRLY